MLPQEDQFRFRLEDIIISNFRIGLPSQGIALDQVALEFAANLKLDLKSDLVNCTIHFRFLLPSKPGGESKPIVIMHIDINYVFTVIDLPKYAHEINGVWGLESGVHLTLMSVAFSTSRGIVFERTRGYPFNKLLIPIIAPDQLGSELLPKPEIIPSPSVSEQPS